ncbi:RagB/SusD family nutrient uptake outer membrane protein [Algivirga pacifica]|uniref:Starch-binding associating with outer membrane n=1 Tax=Algivirga pacifica TaxID=1162670 RepID=A0ABP9D8L9_9BACT
MKISKQILVAMLGAASAFTTACSDDFLDRTQQAALTDGSYFQTEADAETALVGAYSVLNHLRIAQTKFILGDVSTPDAEKGSTATDGAYIAEIKNFTAAGDNIGFKLAWYPQWNGIYYVNKLLLELPEIEMSEAKRASIEAQGKFLRGFYYFELAKNFGGLPLMDAPAIAGEYDYPRASLEETYAFIEKDLTEAIAVLPMKSEIGTENMGRATKGAAVALLGKVQLYGKKFADAKTTLKRLVDGDLAGEYSLVEGDYEAIFRQAGEHGSESVFEINYLGDDNGTWDNGGNFNTVFQMPRLWGWGFNQPTQTLVDAFEIGDPRLPASILTYLEAQVLEDAALGSVVATKNSGFYQRKSYIYPDARPDWWRKSSENYRVIRLSDVYLMYAEAAAQDGDDATAQMYLNKVRERARNAGMLDATPGFTVVDVDATTVGSSTDLDALAQAGNLVIVDIMQEDSPLAAAGVTNVEVAAETVAGEDVNKWALTNAVVIQAIDGTPVTSKADFYSMLAGKAAGTSVAITYAKVNQTIANGAASTTVAADQVVNVNLSEILPDVNATGQALLDAIYHERRVELASEHHRFYDIVRTGKGAEVLGPEGFKEGTHNFFPIPQEDIDLSNGVLTPNPWQ